MPCKTPLIICFDHIEDRYALDIGKIPVAEKFQVGRIGVDVHPAVQDRDGAGLLLESLATVCIVLYDITHRQGG